RAWRSVVAGHGLRRGTSCALIFLAVVAVALLGTGDAALAQCSQNGAGQTTCTNSTFLTGGKFGILDNSTTLTVTNTAPGTISGSQSGIFANNDANVTNLGIIFGGSDHGI